MEYDLWKLKGGVRGKYYREATAGTNLILIEPELASVFPTANLSIARSVSLPIPHSRLQQINPIAGNPQPVA